MPTTVNGCGTTYFGKKNKKVYEAQCESCGQVAQMMDYDTRYCICLIFIPIIPIGKKRILGDCSRCRRHRALPLHEWQKIENESIQETAADFSANPDDPEKAFAMLGTLDAFNRRDEAIKLCDLLSTKFPDDFDVQFSLGAWNEKFGRAKECDACFERAHKIDPKNPAGRRAVGLGHLEKDRISEAQELLKPLHDDPETRDVAASFMLAAGLQKHERHEDALQIFQDLNQDTPELGKDDKFRTAVQKSEKALGRENSILPGKGFSFGKFFKIAAAIAIVAGIFYWNHSIAQDRRVHVVNGLTEVIQVQIGDEMVSVPPMASTSVSLAEGTHTTKVIQPTGVAPLDFEVSSGWFGRFFKSPVYVVDPTQTAAVIYEESEYSANPNPMGGSYEIHIGEPFLSWDDIDYDFKAFPNQLKVSNSSTSVTKTRVSVPAGTDPINFAASELGRDLSSPKLHEFLRRHVELRKESKAAVEMYFGICAASNRLADCQTVLENGLQRKPVDIGWHRMYQECRSMQQNDENIVEIYDDLLKQAPNDSGLLYLRARIDTDPDRAEEFLTQATNANPRNHFVWQARGFAHLCRGDFAAAQEQYEKAIELSPDKSDNALVESYHDALMGQGRLKEAEQDVRRRLQQDQFSILLHERLLTIFFQQNRGGEITTHLTDLKKRLGPVPDPYQRPQKLQMFADWLKGDTEAVANSAKMISQGKELWEFQIAVDQGDIDAARKLAENSLVGMRNHPMLYVLMAIVNGSDEEAALTALQESLREGDRDGKALASLLTDGYDVNKALKQTLGRIDKASLLTILAWKNPSDASQLLALAEKLNLSPQFPHRLIKNAIATVKLKK